ncbi:hypothetical protein BSPWISOXPB_6649 [uncultured Gammaproteobacteria bacterium]|nr:hypothetical protein BSPWISOXPB_6649 [uncultured Gammaproteobacteria bacterium]
MKHTKMKGFTSIKSDDFEGKAVDIVDIVDGDEVGWGHHHHFRLMKTLLPHKLLTMLLPKITSPLKQK